MSTPAPPNPLESPSPTWMFGAGRRWLLLVIDAAIAGLSLHAAYWAHFEGQVSPADLHHLWRLLPLLVIVRLATSLAFGIHHWSFRLAGLSEAVRLVAAGLAGTGGFVFLVAALGVARPPHAVTTIELFLTTTLVASLRFSFRLVQPWLLGQRRSSFAVNALIVGAGSEGDLLLRDLARSGDHRYNVVGFVDDDPRKRRMSIGGRPVLGDLSALPLIVRKKDVRELLICSPSLPPERLREIVTRCAEFKLKYRRLPISFAYLNDRLNQAQLADLAPEDLLAREPAGFDTVELARLAQGRRVLVTGGGGSIGSEIVRQMARLGAAEVVVLDVNENALYLLYREMLARYPQVRVTPEVADIRDRRRLLQVVREHRPHDVFHAAAHKHVPLLESTPHEAVKNNVFGCRNVIEAAEDGAAQRFVLISTDKAVQPSSVMGATKRLAEMMIRARAAHSPTRFTAVRFGNVLGSSGSVVPLFKHQIAAGGPVTVTHPDVRRYLMTINEAVGLVIQAGLGDFGDLCVLEMGEPIRILELAQLMITVCGLVPDVDIPIVFTGLRPGEKLEEALLTDEEMRESRRMTRKIRSVAGSAPPADLATRLARLEAAAASDHRENVMAALRAAVPEYAPLTDAAEPSGVPYSGRRQTVRFT